MPSYHSDAVIGHTPATTGVQTLPTISLEANKNQPRMASSAALWYRLLGRYSWLRQRLFTAGSRVRTPYQLCTVALRSSFCNSQAPFVPYDLHTRRSAHSQVRTFSAGTVCQNTYSHKCRHSQTNFLFLFSFLFLFFHALCTMGSPTSH